MGRKQVTDLCFVILKLSIVALDKHPQTSSCQNKNTIKKPGNRPGFIDSLSYLEDLTKFLRTVSPSSVVNSST